MAEQEVTVKINQTGSGNAIETTRQALERLRAEAAKEFPQTAAKIQQLYKAAGVYESRGDTGMAQTARADAKVLEGDLLRVAKERYAAERAVTLEHKDRDAIAKAQESRGARVARTGAGIVENAAGGSPAGGLLSALGSAGPMAAIAAAVAAVALKVVGHYAEKREKDESLRNEQNVNAATSGFDQLRSAGVDGSSAGSRESEIGEERHMVELRAQRAELERKARPSWYDPRRWSNSLFGTEFQTDDGIRGLKGNEHEMDESNRRRKQDKEIAEKKFAEFGAPMIQAAEKEAQMNMAGARAIRDKVDYAKEYNRIIKEHGTTEEAARGAEAMLANTQRQRAGMFASLVTGATGTAGTARIAQAAREQRLSGGQFASTDTPALNLLIHTINHNHQQAMHSMEREKFKR